MYVPFDRDFAQIGFIEPVFVQEVVGYWDRHVVPDETVIATWCEGAGMPVMMKSHVEWLPEPVPKIAPLLRWRRVDA